MKETYSHEFNTWQKMLQKTLGMWRINRDSIDFKWGYFAPRWGLELSVNQGGYFHSRYSLDICLGWGMLNIKLPFKTKRKPDCEWPHYGIRVFGNALWIDFGRWGCNGMSSYLHWDLPYFSYTNHQLEVKDAGGNWVKLKGNDAFFQIDSVAGKSDHEYQYLLRSGEIQKRTATIYEERRTWNRKWFPFLKLITHAINVSFSDEVGERSGSWKGGTVGCGYEVLPGETAVECLHRMERERKF